MVAFEPLKQSSILLLMQFKYRLRVEFGRFSSGMFRR